MKGEQAPPSYTETSGQAAMGGNRDPEKNVPPSYDSLFGKAKALKAESSGNVDFFKKLIAVFAGSIGCTIFLGITLALPIAMIIIGAKYLDDCPEERLIPVWLVVSGVVGLLRNIMALGCRVGKKKEGEQGAEGEEGEKSCKDKLMGAFDSLLGTFAFAWFIAGNVWVYRSKGDISSDSTAVNYCHPTVYWFSFWVITGSYILIGCVCFCCCFCCICLICCMGKKGSDDQ